MIAGLFPKFAICNNTEPFLLRNDKGLAIRGSVKQSNAPIPCRVRLFEKLTGRILFDKETDQYGNYEFNHLALSKYFIIAHHPTSGFNALIFDNLMPK